MSNEPPEHAEASTAERCFVVQKHAARALHYDFRLELGGVLKSWAIPKGPSLDPADKRMAIHVEDHPLSYRHFEGVIPKGQYGAGEVLVWDSGGWEPLTEPHAAYRQGRLQFRLHGKKLHGDWALVRMHERPDAKRKKPHKAGREAWLLMKKNDDAARGKAQYDVVSAEPNSVLQAEVAANGAGMAASSASKLTGTKRPPSRPAAAAPDRDQPARGWPLPDGAKAAPLPRTLAPQLATLVTQAPAGDGWSYEIKFDGYRILARVAGDDVRLITRNALDWSARLPGVVDAVRALRLGSGWLDGEIVVAGAHGAPDFNALQNAFDTKSTDTIEYVVFDLPYIAGHDLRNVPLAERRGLLAKVLDAQAVPLVRFSQDFATEAATLLHDACRVQLEGVIGKRIDSPYVSRRSPSWIKLKCTRRQEFVVGGYTDPKGSRTGLGSLLLGYHDGSGRLLYAGAVGSGFDTTTLGALKRTLAGLPASASAFADSPRVAGAHWVRPSLVAEVSFAEWTRAGRIRHAVFHGLRDDKPAAAITREQATPPAQVQSRTNQAPTLPKGLRVSHPQRVIDPDSGASKLDLVNYYLEVARTMLPHLAKRPVSLVRAPGGVAAHTFMQRHAGAGSLRELKTLGAQSGFDGMLEIDSFAALIGAAQANAVEFHTWNATTRQPAKPDRMVFDLDPGEGLAWKQMLQAAALTRRWLDELGLTSFLKTSGGKGLHLVVPLRPVHGWELVRNTAKLIVERLAADAPDRFVAKSGQANRVGKIFVDHLRNGYGSTTVCAWSVRARPGLGISVPCSWDELGSLRGGDHWTLGNVQHRLQDRIDAWAGYAKARQPLTTALDRLAG